MDSHPYVPHEKHKDLLEKHRATWHGITRVMLYSVIGVVTLLVLMDLFLIKHS